MSRQFAVFMAIAVTLGAIAVPIPLQNESIVYRIPVTGEIELGLAPYIQRTVQERAVYRSSTTDTRLAMGSTGLTPRIMASWRCTAT